MKLTTRLIIPKDYSAVLSLLKESGFSTMEQSDIEHDTLVADLDGQIVGCVWCLIGKSSTCYIGYFAVRRDKLVQKVHTAPILIWEALKYVYSKGCTKLIGILTGNEEIRMSQTYTRTAGLKLCGRFTMMFNPDIKNSIKQMISYFHYLDKGTHIPVEAIQMESRPDKVA